MNTWLLALKPALVGLALIAWWFRRRRFGPRSFLLGAQLAIATAVESRALYLSAHHIPNLWLYDLYVPVEFVLLLGYVAGRLPQRWQRSMVGPTLLLMAVAYGADLKMRYPGGFVSGAFICGSLILVAALLVLLYDLALRVDRALVHQPLFWTFLGLVLFFSGMVPVLGLLNQLNDEDAGLMKTLFLANHVLFALRYGALVIACAIADSRSGNRTV